MIDRNGQDGMYIHDEPLVTAFADNAYAVAIFGSPDEPCAFFVIYEPDESMLPYHIVALPIHLEAIAKPSEYLYLLADCDTKERATSAIMDSILADASSVRAIITTEDRL